MDTYQKIQKLGEGTYGIVYKAQNRKTQEIVALKRIRLDNEDEGVPCTAIREIALLKELKHPNIVKLLDVLHTEKKLTLVFEYMDSDLKKYCDANGELDAPTIQSFMFQLLRGVGYCHSKQILHRDVKPQNILISKKLELKLADFGLSRAFGVPVRSYSHEVVTLWYRSVDVLLGSKQYDSSIDMWSVGAIMGEISTGHPMFAGNSPRDQLQKIFQVLGTPTAEQWPGYEKLPEYNLQQEVYEAKSLALLYPRLDTSAMHLLNRLLTLDPEKRISAQEALQHPYFNSINQALAQQT